MSKDTKARLEDAGLGPVTEEGSDAFGAEFGKDVASHAQNMSIRFLKAEELDKPRAFAFEGNTVEEIEQDVEEEGKKVKRIKKLSFWTLRDRTGQRFSLSESHQLQKMRTRKEIKPGDYVSLHFQGVQKAKLGTVKLWGIKVLPLEQVPESKRF